jgi:hypothetical protein
MGFAVPGRRAIGKREIYTLLSKPPILLLALIPLAILSVLVFNRSTQYSLHRKFSLYLLTSHQSSSPSLVLIAPENRDLIPSILELNNLTVGAELGVQVSNPLKLIQIGNFDFYFPFYSQPPSPAPLIRKVLKSNTFPQFRTALSRYIHYVNGTHARDTI